jgi:hypothetical protein
MSASGMNFKQRMQTSYPALQREQRSGSLIGKNESTRSPQSAHVRGFLAIHDPFRLQPFNQESYMRPAHRALSERWEEMRSTSEVIRAPHMYA